MEEERDEEMEGVMEGGMERVMYGRRDRGREGWIEGRSKE